MDQLFIVKNWQLLISSRVRYLGFCMDFVQTIVKGGIDIFQS